MTRKQSPLSGTGRHVEMTITLVLVTASFQSPPQRGALGRWGQLTKEMWNDSSFSLTRLITGPNIIAPVFRFVNKGIHEVKGFKL